MHVLLVTKDKGSFNFVKPGFHELVRRGHRVRIVAEGLSTGLWASMGAEIVPDGKELLHDIIVVGTSAPTNLEQLYADFANVSGIPLVLAEDSFGACNRIDGDAKLILTINTIAGAVIDRGGRHQGTPWKPVGSPAVSEPGISPELVKEHYRLVGEFGKLVLYSGQGSPSSIDIFNKTVELIRASKRQDVVLVIKHHPKAQIEVTEQMMQGVQVKESPFGSDDLARIADYTMSCFGTALNVSAANGKTPVSVWTPGTEENFRKQTGLEKHPLFEAGLVALATSATASFLDLVWSDVSASDREAVRSELGRKLDPAAFADAVESAAA